NPEITGQAHQSRVLRSLHVCISNLSTVRVIYVLLIKGQRPGQNPRQQRIIRHCGPFWFLKQFAARMLNKLVIQENKW
ncbi:hypothetical protein, partial [Acetobacter estunensis]|uniref:hypothetical protein n=1 Tax=Acetobacter estunensis TaxID=104097 RepID=UPI00222EB401